MEMSKAVINCMQLLRRRVRNELGIEIHLHQPDAIAALLMASRTARDPETCALGEQLASLTEQLDPSATAAIRAQAGPPAEDQLRVRIYRGQRVIG